MFLWLFALTTRLHSSKLVSRVFSPCESRRKVNALSQCSWNIESTEIWALAFRTGFCCVCLRVDICCRMNDYQLGGGEWAFNSLTANYCSGSCILACSDSCILNHTTILAWTRTIGINLFEDHKCKTCILCVVWLGVFGVLFWGSNQYFVTIVIFNNPAALVKSFFCNQFGMNACSSGGFPSHLSQLFLFPEPIWTM